MTERDMMHPTRPRLGMASLTAWRGEHAHKGGQFRRASAMSNVQSAASWAQDAAGGLLRLLLHDGVRRVKGRSLRFLTVYSQCCLLVTYGVKF